MSDSSEGLFQVVIGAHDLGVFTGCRGLESGPESGAIVLSRPWTRHAAVVSAWMDDGGSDEPGTEGGEITMLGPERAPLACWTLEDVVPVQWNGAVDGSGDADSGLETLELSCAGLSKVI
ncbi:tail tube protein gp19 [Saccharopolyspora erythraea NRRL 2338]|uniref:Uncharacterized protein n=2 Tax=Saccharopolyspora erythraea TaxID=1836 RepID=A4FHG1_SACEN|nr:hypothetical protein [Saccharopolyspora erythraea]EQD81648.1 hypothetical protein N599_34975 [Saccharopolyspora erythraea D]PFG97181.1 tail tube protein gp19 [Saccharopolyspora erythraea NRRL 2338]QRK87382.1 hypothetical protein JQX30_21500 [Saccharopolyspora erythraea]CAM03486.1 hypothetical protein SACE_4217 [Saccharopolyspora erythraea NRRL 2338]